jgi:hypothetical protein
VASENSPIEAERRYPDVAAHLRACGPCSEDLDGLQATIASDPQD